MSGDEDNAEPVSSQAPSINSKKRTLETENDAHGNKKKKEHKNSRQCTFCDRTFSRTGNLNQHVKRFHTNKFEQGSETASKKSPKRGKGHRRTGKGIKRGNTNETGGEDRPCASSDRYAPIVYHCSRCKTATINIDSTVKHAELHKQPNFEPIISLCDICGWSFEPLYNHSSIHACNTDQGFLVLDYNPDRILDKDWRDRFLVSIKTYAKQIKSSSIYQHTRKVKMNSNSSSGRPLYKCSRCLMCVRPEEVEDHCDLDGECEETVHPTNFCTQCDEIFYTSSMLEEHKKEHERYGADGFRTITFNSKEDAPIEMELKKFRNKNQALDISTCTHVLLRKPMGKTKPSGYAGPYRVLKRTKDTVTVDVLVGEVTVKTIYDGIVVPISPTYIAPYDVPYKTRSNRTSTGMSIYKLYYYYM